MHKRNINMLLIAKYENISTLGTQITQLLCSEFS